MLSEDEKLSLLGLFSAPDSDPLDQADIQQFIIYRTPLAASLPSVNNFMYNGQPVEDIKYFDGTNLVNVILELNGEIVWSKQ